MESFQRTITLIQDASGKRKADAKVTTLRRIFQIFTELFFKTPDPDGEPAGSSPKAGAKVQAFNVTAKHINHFFQEFDEVFYTCADIQMVTTERKRGRKRKEGKGYTI